MPHIYIIKNTVNDKCYIGQTKGSIENRFKKHIGQRNCKNQCSALYAAFRKYGVECFFVESLISGNLSKEELNDLEVEYIKKHKSLSPTGYNLQTGGGSFEMSRASCDKISKALKGRKITWANKISIGVKKLWDNDEYREKQVNQRSQKRGKYRDGIVRLKSRKPINIDEFEKDYSSFMDLKDISKKYDVSIHTIYKIIKREKIQKRGYKCNKKEG